MKRFYLAACLPLLLLIGCASGYDDYYYLPHPGVAELPATQPSQPPAVTAFATIVGVVWPDDRKAPPVIQTRLRLHNNSAEAVSFDPHSINLTTSDLVPFPPPILNSPAQLTIGPGESAMISADFPFPDGKLPEQLDLSSLQLRWSVQTGTGNAEQTISFQRHISRSYYYSDPYWAGYPYAYPYPYPVFGGDVIIRHR